MINALKGTVVNPDKIYGKSAYEIAVAHGFNGTEAEWLESLTELARLNAEQVIEKANEQIDLMNSASEAAQRNIDSAESDAVSHIQEMAENTLNIVQTTGDSETAVMSQKAVTELVAIDDAELTAILDTHMPISAVEDDTDDTENGGDDTNTEEGGENGGGTGDNGGTGEGGDNGDTGDTGGEEDAENTLRGVWSWNDTIKNLDAFTDMTSIAVNFTSAAPASSGVTETEFVGFLFNCMTLSYYYNNGLSATDNIHDNNFSVYSECKQMDFGNTAQEVDADFYAWFIQNASKIS